MNAKIVSIIFLAFCITRIKGQNNYCYLDDNNPYQRFGSLTSYDVVRDKQMEIPGDCTPMYMWALVKYGPQYMSKETSDNIDKLSTVKDQIIKNRNAKRDKLCDKDLDLIKNWNFKKETDKAGELTTQAIETTKEYIVRLKQKLPVLLDSKARTTYEFHTADTKQCKETALKISNELFGIQSTDFEKNDIIVKDNVLQLSNHCPNWKNGIEQPERKKELDAFVNSDLIKTKLIKEVSNRLGYEEKEQLTFDDIKRMYECCAFEFADGKLKPPFCAAFTQEQSKIMEYSNDIGHYFKYGYGNPDSDKMGCPIIQTMLNNLTNVAEKPDIKVKATFHFAPSPILTNIIVKLGLLVDTQPPRTVNFDSLIENRLWRTSAIDPHSANFIAVLLSCSNNNDKQVAFYLNEKILELPGCNGKLCPVSFLKKKYEDVFKPDQCGSKLCTDSSKDNTNGNNGNGAEQISGINLFVIFIPFLSHYIYRIFS